MAEFGDGAPAPELIPVIEKSRVSPNLASDDRPR
jgi:hypothetical protein